MLAGKLSNRDRFDPDAWNYIKAVELADGQPLEAEVRRAITRFLKGCKKDGIWSAIKASCILSGARTLAGALVPLKGAAPTNFNFVSNDYNRKIGLKGNGVDKRLLMNYSFPTSLQNNSHISTYFSQINSTVIVVGGYGDAIANGSFLHTQGSRLYQSSSSTYAITGNPLYFHGISRDNESSYIHRHSGINVVVNTPSQSILHENQSVFARSRLNGSADVFSDGAVSFYSIGESINLQKLDTRVTTLMNAFNTYIL